MLLGVFACLCTLKPESPASAPADTDAVCLYSQEAIGRVRTDGHQAFPGAYGESLTLLGLNWAALAPGDQLAIGDAATGLRLELVKHAAPCQTIAHWSAERRISRISGKTHPGDARWYARVLREGAVAPGMDVRLERGPDFAP